MIEAGKTNGLNLYCEDYLEKDFEEKFQLIFWATLEHLSNPISFLKNEAGLSGKWRDLSIYLPPWNICESVWNAMAP